MKKLICITSDTFDVSRRLRALDDGYRVMYNVVKKRFELHHMALSPTLQVVFPYSQLDSRSYNYALKTRGKDAVLELKKIEAENEKMRIASEHSLVDEMRYKSRHLAEYIGKGGENLPSYDRL